MGKSHTLWSICVVTWCRGQTRGFPSSHFSSAVNMWHTLSFSSLFDQQVQCFHYNFGAFMWLQVITAFLNPSEVLFSVWMSLFACGNASAPEKTHLSDLLKYPWLLGERDSQRDNCRKSCNQLHYREYTQFCRSYKATIICDYAKASEGCARACAFVHVHRTCR